MCQFVRFFAHEYRCVENACGKQTFEDGGDILGCVARSIAFHFGLDGGGNIAFGNFGKEFWCIFNRVGVCRVLSCVKKITKKRFTERLFITTAVFLIGYI